MVISTLTCAFCSSGFLPSFVESYSVIKRNPFVWSIHSNIRLSAASSLLPIFRKRTERRCQDCYPIGCLLACFACLSFDFSRHFALTHK
ncbi:unnamed protein product [Periconia digitata]|uniref:Uncharacterized protein n=1 Tax=Periconia digitata TaxID=1303443 RepID=A0A9W4UJI1_9PLEO|nr:unnamed protein product [Periconia digitata]